MTAQEKRFFDQINGLLNANIIGTEDRTALDFVLEEVEALIKTPRPEDDAEAVTLYNRYKELIGSYGTRLGEVRYALPLGMDEFKWFKNVVKKNVKFTRDEIYVIQRVYDEFVVAHDKKTAAELETVRIAVEMASWMSFVIGKVEFVGITESFNTTLTLNTRLNQIQQIFNYYNRSGEELATRARNWVQGISEEGAADIAAAEQLEG